MCFYFAVTMRFSILHWSCRNCSSFAMLKTEGKPLFGQEIWYPSIRAMWGVGFHSILTGKRKIVIYFTFQSLMFPIRNLAIKESLVLKLSFTLNFNLVLVTYRLLFVPPYV